MKRQKLVIYGVFIVFLVAIVILNVNISQQGQMISIYGGVMLAYLMFKMVLAFKYKPIEKPFNNQNKISVLVPVYNEKTELLIETITTIMQQTYPIDSIYIFDDGSKDTSAIDAVERYKSTLGSEGNKIHIYKSPVNVGKRMGQIYGIKRSDADFFVTVDSDCFLHKNAIEELMKPFNDPSVYAVSGHVIARNRKVNLLTTLIDMRYENAFRVERAAQSVTGNILVCSGPLSAYRREVLIDNLEKYESQMFLGAPVQYGDDRCLTNYAIQYGKTVYQSTAVCETDVPETLTKFLKQQVRWNNSFFRESIIGLKIGFKRPFVLFWILLELSLWLLFSISLILAIYYQVTNFAWILIFYTLCMSCLTAYSRNVFYIIRHPFLFLFAPLYGIIHMTCLLPIRLYSLFTLRDKKWGTR